MSAENLTEPAAIFLFDIFGGLNNQLLDIRIQFRKVLLSNNI